MQQGFKSLLVWQKSIELAKAVYAVAEALPQKEQFALANQLRRAAVFVASNIAEGSRRSTRKDYIQFFRITHGSVAEIETQLCLVKELYGGVDTAKA